jgi:succinate-semialdehyde dehydrogenase / glutarate-semialdehyde dehydrogenase
MGIELINPTNGELLKQYDEMPWDDVKQIIEATDKAYHKWSAVDIDDRAKPMRRVASLLEEQKNDLAKTITLEMGKPITQAKKEIEKCIWVCEYYAEQAKNHLAPRIIETEMQSSYVVYRPIGVVFAVMPWNFPFWQVFRFAAPTLMAGNAALLKHAPNVTGAALAIEEIIQKAGFPAELFRTVVVSNDVAKSVIEHDAVKAVTLTGSARAGRAVGASAAGALKKVVLELGGCDAYLVLKDADLDEATDACIASRLNNCGQVCISAKRIIVIDDVKKALVEKIKQKMKAYVKSDPMHDDCTLGPMARDDLRQTVHAQVETSIQQGARCELGGKMDTGEGFFYPATLLLDVKPGMPAFDEEIFGPVVSVISVKDEDEAIRLANDSCFGLSAGVFTKDIEKGEKIARDQLIAGICCVNTFAASDPRLPFGGVKQSGYGRELSAEGIREFCNIKTVCIK